MDNIDDSMSRTTRKEKRIKDQREIEDRGW